VLSVEGALPEPCEVEVLRPRPEPPDVLPFSVGATYPERRTVWFRRQPPAYSVFAHELVHLVRQELKPLGPLREEAYALVAGPVAVALAREGVRPPANPVRLLHVSVGDILEAARVVYGRNFTDVDELIRYMGADPLLARLKVVCAEEAGAVLRLTWVLSDEPEHVARWVVDELAQRVGRDPVALRVVVELLRIVARRVPR